jgi:hypothetical protein
MTARTNRITLSFLLLVAAASTSCRAIQIHDLEKRVDSLETRVAVLESKTAR